MFTLEVPGQGAHWQHAGKTDIGSTVLNHIGHSGCFDHWLGIRCDHQSGDTARGNRCTFTGDGAFARRSRFAQSGAEVDQTGANHLAFGINDFISDKARGCFTRALISPF